MAKANNVTRLLDSHGISYTVYELPSEKISALEAAAYLGVDPDRVFKTIVVTREGLARPVLAVIPGPREVDLKALARALGEKKVHLATQRQAEQITGLQVGGISPLALLNRGFTVVLDAAAEIHPEIYISGGQRGLNVCLPVSELVSLSKSMLAEISV
jgi:Cys-tRNA(Pro)/Cys-tRNA(Cys) deacylase